MNIFYLSLSYLILKEAKQSLLEVKTKKSIGWRSVCYKLELTKITDRSDDFKKNWSWLSLQGLLVNFLFKLWLKPSLIKPSKKDNKVSDLTYMMH